MSWLKRLKQNLRRVSFRDPRSHIGKPGYPSADSVFTNSSLPTFAQGWNNSGDSSTVGLSP